MEIRNGDTGWQELYDLWQEDGAAATFERIEEEGNCQRWSVMQQPSDDYVRFLLVSAQEGTETGNDRPEDWAGPRSGYSVENRAAGVKVRDTGKGWRIRKQMPPIVESTVTLE